MRVGGTYRNVSSSPIYVQKRSNAQVPALIADLKACSSLPRAKLLHEAAIQCGLVSNVCVANTLIHVYAKCASLKDARKVFDSMTMRTEVSWTALALGHAYNGEPESTLEVFSKMGREGFIPNDRTVTAAIKACVDLAVRGNDVFLRGKALNMLAATSGCEQDNYVKNALLHLYAKCGSMNCAQTLFERIESPDLVSWNALITGYADNGEGDMALNLFSRMRHEGCFPDQRTIVSIAKVCTSITGSSLKNKTILRDRGRALQFMSSTSGFDTDLYVRSALVGLYAKCGSMVDARRAFDGMDERNVVSWTSLILGYADNGEGEMALASFSRMAREGCEPDARTLVAALKACSDFVVTDVNNGNMQTVETIKERGRLLHWLASRHGCDSDIYVMNTLMMLYVKCGSMKDARGVFDTIKEPDVVSWTALIFGYAEAGESETALDMLARMEAAGCEGDSRTFVAALKACTDLAVDEEENVRGKALHILASRSGCDSDLYVQGTLVDMYAKYGIMEDARSVFEPKSCDIVSWNALISGYADNGEGEMALEMFSRLRRSKCIPDSRTFVAALKACTDIAEEASTSTVSFVVKTLKRGKALHLLASTYACDADIYVKGTLVDFYGKCKNMRDALCVFKSMENPSVVMWTSLVSGYGDSGDCETALGLFSKMKFEGCLPNERTFVAAAKACADLAVKEENPGSNSKQTARALHLLAMKTECVLDMYVQNTLLDMYCKCGCMSEAYAILKSIPSPDVISWNTLISGYADNEESEMALTSFSKLGSEGCEPDTRTFVASLKACADLIALEVGDGRTSNAAARLRPGKALHILALKCGCGWDIYVVTTLVDMYAKGGLMDVAWNVFHSVEHPNVVAWTALICGYADNGDGDTSLELFLRMKREGAVPDGRTFVSALKACSTLGALEFGKRLHGEICDRGLDNDPIVANCLVDFYAKCGNLTQAEEVFSARPSRNLVTWTTLMAGYGRCGDSEAVFNIFDRLLDAGLRPNGVTFLCLLTACNHAGLVDKGKDYFREMCVKYGIHPDVEHYTCMIDILGRANKLDNAMVLMRNMRFTPDAIAWTTVLGACRKWGNMELGKLAFESLETLGDKNSGPYVLMANAGEEQ